MGARVSRVFRNFNVEARAHREISKSKPEAAPRYRNSVVINNESAAEPIVNKIHRKDDPLLSRLKQVYVQSMDPQPQTYSGGRNWAERAERRPVSVFAAAVPPGVTEVTDVPVGKLTLVEALTALNNYKNSPGTWPAERIGQELKLTPSDAQALVSYFIPFDIKLLPSQSDNQRLTDS
ncbi:NADH dehydrogenase [ubiquinone] 1 alpha subcomplex assembly factor 4 [Trichomycterus rosablanca]|uniref:NADH dehydrogenase [ubiquinone] 1 alpha subcomplex assembly factor 4 n=1 Tax=Trichomycterus rosablanca TaxID=2290929 RepID=UPI002F359103